MSRYRLYKNGIYGQRYEGKYIVPERDENGRASSYSIWTADKEVVQEGLMSFEDAMWEISLGNASAEDIAIIRKIDGADDATIQRLTKELIESGKQEDTPEGKTAYKWLTMVGYRKKRGLKVL